MVFRPPNGSHVPMASISHTIQPVTGPKCRCRPVWMPPGWTAKADTLPPSTLHCGQVLQMTWLQKQTLPTQDAMGKGDSFKDARNGKNMNFEGERSKSVS